MTSSAHGLRRAHTPTMDDVAAAAGVSRALVSLVMRESPRASAQARAAVHEAASRLGYRRNLVGSNLASRRTMTIAPRRAGYLSAMRAVGLGDRTQVLAGDFTEEAGNRAGQRSLREGPLPTAFFTANDLSAVGLIDALGVAGLAVPAHSSVVGYDNTAFAGLNHIGLTTIDQPRNSIGRLAAAMLLDALIGVGELSHVLMRPHLVVRSTTGPCRVAA